MGRCVVDAISRVNHMPCRPPERHGVGREGNEAVGPEGDLAVRLVARAVRTPTGLAGTWELLSGTTRLASGKVTLSASGEGALPAPPHVADWALMAALPAAVRLGGRLTLAGVATRRGLADAAELSRAWASFRAGPAFPLILDADELADSPALAGASRMAAVLGPGEALPAVPPALSLVAVVLDGADAGFSPPAGVTALRLAAEGEVGPLPGFFSMATRRAAALHLLSAEARYGLLRLPSAETPRMGGPAAPSQAASFLSSGTMEVVPDLDLGERFAPATGLARPGLGTGRRPVVAHFEQAVRNGATRRALVLEGLADRPVGERVTMWWDMPGEPDLPTPPVLDQMAAAALLPAMVRGQDLVLRGPLSRLASVYFPRLAATRAAWGSPAPAGPVAIMPDAVVDPPPPAGPPRAVLTFSGGVDSFHSLLWRTGADAPPAEPPLAAAVLSLGFDIPLAQRAAFEVHRARIAPVLERRGVALHVVHTNSRALGLAEWDLVAVPMIIAALSQFAHRYAWGLIGGARPYPDLHLPVISPPLLDRALSGNWFSVATEASGLGRTERVARVAADAEASAVLRVCYDERSPDFSRNCCLCPKCQRTMLNFLAVGVARPACFAHVPPPEELVELPIYKADDPLLLKDLIAYARAHGTAGAWTDRLEARLAAWRPPATTLPGRIAAKASLWVGRMRADPLATPGLAIRKALARLAGGGRRA
jgi:hypothetical protein